MCWSGDSTLTPWGGKDIWARCWRMKASERAEMHSRQGRWWAAWRSLAGEDAGRALHVGNIFPGGSVGKESACSAREPGLTPGLSWRRKWPPTLVLPCLENSSWAGYSPWDRKESDTTVWLTFTFTCTGEEVFCRESVAGERPGRTRHCEVDKGLASLSQKSECHPTGSGKLAKL